MTEGVRDCDCVGSSTHGSHCHTGGTLGPPLPAGTGSSAERNERRKRDTGAEAGLMHVALQLNHRPKAAAAESSAETVMPASMLNGNGCAEVLPPTENPASITMGMDTGAHMRWTAVLSRVEILRALA